MKRPARRTRPAPGPAPAPEPDWKRCADRLFDTNSRQEQALMNAQALAWSLQQALNSNDPKAADAAVVLAGHLAGVIEEGLKPTDLEAPHAA